METFSVQHVDIDHTIKEALVLFTKHPPCLGLAAASQNYKKCESNWFVQSLFFYFIVPPISQLCKYLLNILPYLNLRFQLSLLTGL